MNLKPSLTKFTLVMTICIVLLGCLLGTVAQGQDLPSKAQVVETLDFSAWDASVTSERVEKLLSKAIQTSKLRPLQKIRANLIINTNFAPKLKQQMIVEATSKLIEAEKVSSESGDVVALVDWDAIFAFLEKLLPLLLQLFG
jgi:hypothetical protein